MVAGAVFVVSLAAAGCSGNSDHLPAFHDLAGAPAAIQTAAQAVVRVETAGEFATGSFISSTGLLLTNNHVLGDSVCPVEGCVVQLAFDFQRGQTLQPFVNVFAVPVAVDVGLDMAVVQIQLGSGSGDLTTPDFLTMVGHEPDDLLGTHITIVGHPEARLKKWTDGQVVDAFGNWFSSTAYILPGDSGSPALDDQGNLVGIVHRSPTGEDLISDDSVDVMAIGTASAPLLAAMAGQPLPSAMISTAAVTTSDAVVASDLVYLNGGAITADVNGAPDAVLDLLGAACDTALARTDFASPDDLSTAMIPCNDALIWIECRVDETPVAAYQTVCPNDASAWTSRFEVMNSLWVAMNGNTDLSPVSFGVAQLQPSIAEGMQAGGSSLRAALAAAGTPSLDFGLSNFLAAFNVRSYGGSDPLTWIRSYHQVPGYQDFGTSIASAYLWWWDNGAIDRAEAIAALNALMRDPQISVGSKLFIDEYLYESGD